MRILCIGDTHFPFTSKAALKKIYKLSRELRPTHIVQLGDLYDMYSWSRYNRTYNLMTPAEELTVGRRMALEFWAALSTKAKRYQLYGNHDARVASRVLERLPEVESLLNIDSLFEFPKVTTCHGERESLLLNGICFQHGFRKAGEHMRNNGVSTVVGHLHKGYVLYRNLGTKTLWELNAGFVADPRSIPMSYTKQRRFADQQHGVGFIDEYGPRFIAL